MKIISGNYMKLRAEGPSIRTIFSCKEVKYFWYILSHQLVKSFSLQPKNFHTHSDSVIGAVILADDFICASWFLVLVALLKVVAPVAFWAALSITSIM